MYDVFIYVKPSEAITVRAETGEIIRRSSGLIRDLNISRAVLEYRAYEEEAKIVYEKRGAHRCSAL
ncbi:hypothetical protein NSQ93_21880 [Bacillus sp. FSL W8-0445]|uniref:Uncharacterized protein n=1 Tax=Bacillus licheniformis TaxID=1402 RepID=A0A8B5YD36_BACLI|nr:hypothetical protein [Bacillus licheniformis]MBJ7887945.1 hypothetical protein [Bacillaceae bacterium HSR45]AMR09492.1 hypothetical protein AB684_04675 [Bacillus licheniformis]AWV39757.1 hypothetical protein CD200_04760 [Bacillus licheniformis]AZN80444.1 hypothetical protein CXG95_15530 [Bacillus licheniformis]KUL09620.1 hypothetical protein LI17339_13795 [Bacillus licheniformis LMG 17339]